jgi:hypothetical protein
MGAEAQGRSSQGEGESQDETSSKEGRVTTQNIRKYGVPADKKPLRVIVREPKAGDGHRRETRVYESELHETYCAYKRCKFYGKHAQQGVCYSDKADLVDWERIDAFEKSHDEELARFRKLYKGKKYVEWLEAMYTSAMLNWQFTLDDTIRLRRDLALLKLQARPKTRRGR